MITQHCASKTRWFRSLISVAMSSVFLCLCACVGGKSAPTSGVVVSAVSSEEESLAALHGAPLDFEVAYPQASYSWERACAFFKQYTAKSAQVVLGPADSTDAPVLLTNRSSGDRIIYEVRKTAATRGGLRFLVSSRAREGVIFQEDFLKMRAQNLARFIRDGNLDLSLTRDYQLEVPARLQIPAKG